MPIKFDRMTDASFGLEIYPGCLVLNLPYAEILICTKKWQRQTIDNLEKAMIDSVMEFPETLQDLDRESLDEEPHDRD